MKQKAVKKRKDTAMAKLAKDYAEVRAEGQKKQSERQAIVKGRNGPVTPRRYAMSKSDAAKLRKQARDDKTFVNPHRLTGAYGIAVQSLANLGANKFHALKDVRAEMATLMRAVPKTIDGKKSNAWIQFSKRPSKNSETGKDVNGRITQNFKVLQRLTGNHRYGEKLQQIFCCIDIKADAKGIATFCLHTGFATASAVKPLVMKRPTKAKAKPKAKKVVKKATKAKAKAKPKAKAKAKPRKKAAKKVSKPKVTTPAPTAPAPVEAVEPAVA